MNRRKYLWAAFFTLLILPGLLLAISWINLPIIETKT
jgi:hydrogenase/urease accessory protein HupE